MLDVHILVMPTTPRRWMKQSIASVLVAANEAPYPINVFVVRGITGHIGKARRRGYSFGSSKYKTYVDDDDYVLPFAFSCLEEALSKNFAGIFTGEIRLQDGKEEIKTHRHNLAVYRSDILEEVDLESYEVDAESASKFYAEHHPDGTVSIPKAPYVWRSYPNSKARLIRKNNSNNWKRAMDYNNLKRST